MHDHTVMKMLNVVQGYDQSFHSTMNTIAIGSKDILLPYIYDEINRRGIFGLIVGTGHVDDFVGHLVDTDKIDKLLKASVRTSQTQQSLKLLEMYYSRHGSLPNECVAEQQGEDKLQKMLTVFARDHSIIL